MKPSRSVINLLLLSVAMFLLTSCAISSKHYSSSLLQYLYPKQSKSAGPSQVSFNLPLKIGIAFVPGTSEKHENISEKDKMDLMKRISQRFKNNDVVDSTVIIPSANLTVKGGFANLYQIRSMYGFDVISLISYDQSQFTDEGFASIAYLTAIGAYFVPGEKNDTATSVNISVFDMDAREMLFEAKGISQVTNTATYVNLSEQLRKDSVQGFFAAGEDLMKVLEAKLKLFKEKLSNDQQGSRTVWPLAD